MIDLKARRPTALRSSLCPAIPTTRVEKTKGTRMHLIIRRKRFETTLRFCETAGYELSGKSQPTAIPTTIEIRIQCVKLIRRCQVMVFVPESNGCAGGVSRLPSGFGGGCGVRKCDLQKISKRRYRSKN